MRQTHVTIVKYSFGFIRQNRELNEGIRLGLIPDFKMMMMMNMTIITKQHIK